jgi:flagellum-specific peptidoglycan hydrolase FlgJ
MPLPDYGVGEAKYMPPENPTKDPACNNVNAVTFVKTHQADAATVAQQLGLPTENILGLSGIESGWGLSRIATTGNNFFSLHGSAGAPFANGSMQALQGASMSTFPSYLACAQSFAAQYGNLVQGKSDPVEFAQGLMPRFNSGKAPLGNPNFISDTVNVIQMTKRRMGC